jgi:hypothetical protein
MLLSKVRGEKDVEQIDALYEHSVSASMYTSDWLMLPHSTYSVRALLDSLEVID